MPTAVTYCRVSSEEQAQKDLSIPAQHKALQRWVNGQPGWGVAADFVDKGQSAYAPADKRPGFCEMVAYCRRHSVDFILVHKLDRFSRNREESILFKSLLRKHGVQIRSVTENYDPETPQGFLYEGMIEVINQFYSMNLGTETIKGMRENAERGYFNGGRAPYGYRVAKVQDDRGREHSQLVPGPEDEIAVVREIFDLSANQGLGERRIVNMLNERGVRSARGGKWSTSSMGNLLRNRVYVGDKVWFRSKRAGRDSRKPTDMDKRVIVEDAHEPLVSRELWERRREASAARPFNHTRAPARHVDYLLSRLMCCAECGNNYVGRKHMVRQTHGPRLPAWRYNCAGYLYKGKAVCTSFPLDKEWAEGVVLELIHTRLCAPEAMEELEQRVRQRIEARRRTYGRGSRATQRKLDQVVRSIENYFRAIGEGLDPAVCRQHIAELEEKKAILEAENEVLQQEDYYTRALEKNVENLRRFAAAFEQDFTSLPFEVQRQVVLHFVEKIEVVERRILRITLKVPFDNNGIELLTDEVEVASSGDGGTGTSARAEAGGGEAAVSAWTHRGGRTDHGCDIRRGRSGSSPRPVTAAPR